MNLIKRILIELDKGGYDNFTDRGLLTLELMRDFKISHSSATYVTTAYWHYTKEKGSSDEEKK